MNLHPFDPGVGAGAIEQYGDATGMMLSDQGAAHTVPALPPFALHVVQTARAQLCPYLRMTVADGDLAPLLGHLESLAEGHCVYRHQKCGNQQQEAAQCSQCFILLFSIPRKVYLTGV